MKIDFNNLNKSDIYKLISRTVVPRPIAWIVTESLEGVINVAPFSYFTPISSKPATLLVSIGHKSTKEPKDTLKNIRDSKKATVCLVNRDNLESMKLSATELPYNVSEAEKYSIDLVKEYEFYPSRIKSSDVAMFCDFHSIVPIEGDTIPIILELKYAFYSDDKIDNNLNANIKNIGRVGKEFIDFEEFICQD